MAPFAENTQNLENSLAEFVRQQAIEDWKRNFQPTAFRVGSYSVDSWQIENQASQFETEIDSSSRMDATKTNDNGFTPNSQTSTENEPRQSLIEELLPYFRRKTVENELRGYPRLEEGWDGINSVPASGLAVQNAISFLAFFPYDLNQPNPMLAADGEVGLYWRNQNAYVELEFAGDGIMFGYARDFNGKETFIDDVPLDSTKEMKKAVATVTRIVAKFPLDDD